MKRRRLIAKGKLATGGTINRRRRNVRDRATEIEGEIRIVEMATGTARKTAASEAIEAAVIEIEDEAISRIGAGAKEKIEIEAVEIEMVAEAIEIVQIKIAVEAIKMAAGKMATIKMASVRIKIMEVVRRRRRSGRKIILIKTIVRMRLVKMRRKSAKGKRNRVGVRKMQAKVEEIVIVAHVTRNAAAAATVEAIGTHIGAEINDAVAVEIDPIANARIERGATAGIEESTRVVMEAVQISPSEKKRKTKNNPQLRNPWRSRL